MHCQLFLTLSPRVYLRNSVWRCFRIHCRWTSTASFRFASMYMHARGITMIFKGSLYSRYHAEGSFDNVSVQMHASAKCPRRHFQFDRQRENAYTLVFHWRICFSITVLRQNVTVNAIGREHVTVLRRSNTNSKHVPTFRKTKRSSGGRSALGEMKHPSIGGRLWSRRFGKRSRLGGSNCCYLEEYRTTYRNAYSTYTPCSRIFHPILRKRLSRQRQTSN